MVPKSLSSAADRSHPLRQAQSVPFKGKGEHCCHVEDPVLWIRWREETASILNGVVLNLGKLVLL